MLGPEKAKDPPPCLRHVEACYLAFGGLEGVGSFSRADPSLSPRPRVIDNVPHFVNLRAPASAENLRAPLLITVFLWSRHPKTESQHPKTESRHPKTESRHPKTLTPEAPTRQATQRHQDSLKMATRGLKIAPRWPQDGSR